MKKGEDHTCPVCQGIYYRFANQIKKGIKLTCSRTCAGLLKQRGEWVPCQSCGTNFYRRFSLAKKGFGKYCSRACEAISRPNGPIERTCVVCNTKFLKDHYSISKFKNNGLFCTRACADKFKRKLRKRNEQEMFTGWQKREWKELTCKKCNSTTHLELDHIIPRFAGGKATQDNAQTLCRTCNRKKFWTDDYPLYLELLMQRMPKC